MISTSQDKSIIKMQKQLIDLSIENYEQELERKSRLESKALGYLTFVSLITAIDTALYVYFNSSQGYVELKSNFFAYIIYHSIVIYIFVCVFVAIFELLQSLKIKKVSKFLLNKKVYERLKHKNDEDYHDLISRRLVDFTNKNIKINDETEDKMQFVYFVLYTICIFSIFLIFFILFSIK
jgi:hypothetical protein